jgi:hypothetical protein
MERVPRGMDRHLQRIMGNAPCSNDQYRSEQASNYSIEDARLTDYSGEAARRLNGDTMLLNELGQSLWQCFCKTQLTVYVEPDRGSYGFESSRQPSTTSGPAPVLDRGPYSFDSPRQASAALNNPSGKLFPNLSLVVAFLTLLDI